MFNLVRIVFTITLLVCIDAIAKPIVLDNKNFTAIRSQVTMEGIEINIKEILLSDKTKPFYLYIDSPGGEVYAAFRLIEVLRNNPQVICISNKAISAAYLITQACPVRLALKMSIFMWHSVSVGGGIDGPVDVIENELSILKQLNKASDELIASRLKITVQELVSKKSPNFWTVGSKAILESNQADEETTVSCTEEVNKITYKEEIQINPFRTIEVEKSICPT